MGKVFMICWLLLTAAFCSVSAGESIWRPDFTPQCGRDENKRNKYLEDEKSSVEHSLAEMEKRGVNIMPTPKNLFFSGKDINISQNDSAGKITVYADKTTSQIPVDMICQRLGKISDIKELGDNVGSSEISVVLLRKDTDAKNPMLPKDIPDFYQGYVIKTLDNNGKRTYVLAGKDYTGLLYATVTFRKLVALKDNSINFPAFNVSDWPDFRYRLSGGLLYEFRWVGGIGEAKKFIDWLLDHKINMTDPIDAEKGKSLYLDAEKKKWLKEVSEYASARGIKVIDRTSAAVGSMADNPGAKSCVENDGYFFCWSNDELLKNRAEKLAQNLKETGAGAVFIHSADTINSKWNDRCQKCRDKFGDDRFSGDAYVFNLYRDEIRKSFPELPIIIVPRPYIGSIDSEEYIKLGEMKSKDDLLRFTKMLVPDVYVCHRENSRPEFISWVNSFRQPMSPCVCAWFTEPTFLDGREFTPMARYFRSYSYPLSNEIADYGTISWSRDRIQTSVFSEFTWNQNFPGSAEYGLTPEKYADLWDPFGKDMSKNKELQSLVKRACDDVFGISNSKYFYNSQLLFTDNKFATNWQDMRYILEKSAMPDLDDKKCAEFMDRIYHNSDIIVKDMETVKKESSDQEIKMKANRLLYYHYYTRVIAHVQTLLLNASLASKKGEHEEADKLIKEAFNVYAEEGQKLKGNWLTIQGQSLEYPRFKIPPFDDSGMKELKNQMDMINVKVQSRKMMADRKNKSTADKKDEAKANKPVKAAVFRPDLKDGLTFGGKGLITLLNGINDIISEEIDNLSPETLKKYDCVIIPDCKSFGKVNANINNIRSYVIDQGGGMYFEHDSCGFNRFPLKGSVFPEIADAKERIGEPISSGERYKKTDRVLKIVKQHPVTAGYADGTSYEQVYFDHIQLGNETGMVLVEDTYGKPVIVAGQSGNGRVVFNGGITLNAVKDEELDKPLATVEGEIIVNSIYWLAKDKKGTELIMAGLKKNDMTLSNMQASVISFKPQIIPCKTLHDVVLTVQCFNAKDLRPISPKIKLSKIDEITEKWESDENVIINAESYPQVRVVMELSSKEGRGVVAKIIGNKE